MSKDESENISAIALTRELPENLRKYVEMPVLDSLDSEGNTALVRDEAKRRKMELSLDNADTYFSVGHFGKAATAYEEATKFITDWGLVDSRILEEARENVEKSPEKAGRKYQRFFSPLRRKK